MTAKKTAQHGNRISLYPLSLEVALSNALRVAPPKTEKNPGTRKKNPAKKAKKTR